MRERPLSSGSPASSDPALRAALPAAAGSIVVAVLFCASAHQVLAGRKELAEADAAAARGDRIGAVAHALQAAEAELPGSPYPERAQERLQALAHDAEARADSTTAVLAYSAMRRAALATTSLFGSSSRWRAVAETGLERVAAWRRDAAPRRDERETAGLAPGIPQGSDHARFRRSEPPSPAASATLAAATLAIAWGVWSLAGGAGDRVRMARAFVGLGLLTAAAVLLGR